MSLYHLNLLSERRLKGHHLGFCRNILPSLEPKILVMCERIGEALKIVLKNVPYTPYTNSSGVKEYASHHAVVLMPSSAHW
jgi:hypothetical protein